MLSKWLNHKVSSLELLSRNLIFGGRLTKDMCQIIKKKVRRMQSVDIFVIFLWDREKFGWSNTKISSLSLSNTEKLKEGPEVRNESFVGDQGCLWFPSWRIILNLLSEMCFCLCLHLPRIRNYAIEAMVRNPLRKYWKCVRIVTHNSEWINRASKLHIFDIVTWFHRSLE